MMSRRVNQVEAASNHAVNESGGRRGLGIQRLWRRGMATTKDAKRTKMEFDDLSNRVIGCAIKVHRPLRPGLLEFAYGKCSAHELNRNGIAFQLQHPQPV